MPFFFGNFFKLSDLFKILHAAFKDLHIEIAVHVLIQVLPDTFAMPHFSEHSAVGRGDTLNRPHRAVGVERRNHRRRTRQVRILRRDLTVRFHLFQLRNRRYNLALAVRYGHFVHFAYLTSGKPRRKVGGGKCC